MNALELFGHWPSVRAGLTEALGMLTDKQLRFEPREGLWCLGQVVCHVAEAEDHWFRYYGVSEWPPADHAFALDDYPTVAALTALLAEIHARTEAHLATLDAADLDREVQLPWGARTTLGWVVWHVLEHEIHHRGEVFLMLGLLGMEAPDV